MVETQTQSILSTHFVERRVSSLNPKVPRSVGPDKTVAEAVELMRQERIGSVLVLDGENKLVGILTERDILRNIFPDRTRLKNGVGSIMTARPQTVQHYASIARALYYMAVGGYRHLPVVYTQNRYGILSVQDFAHFVHDEITKRVTEGYQSIFAEEGKVEQFFQSNLEILRPAQPISVKAQTTTAEACGLMLKRRIGAVIVITERNTIAGIFTERDFLKRLALEERTALNAPIADYMTPEPKTLPSSATVSMAVNTMCEGGFRHLPVVDESEKLIGVVSIKNFTDYLAQSIVSALSEKKEVG